MPYKKRRIQPAANKNEAKILRRESMEKSSRLRLGNLHPDLEQLSIRLEFYDSKGKFISDRHIIFGADDSLQFRVDCVGPCGNGTLEMEGKVLEMVRSQQTSTEGRGKCNQLVHFDSGEICGTELRCHIAAKYKNSPS